MIQEQDEDKIKHLYYKKVLRFDEIAEKFNNKYNEREIKKFILDYIDSFDKTIKENKKQKKVLK